MTTRRPIGSTTIRPTRQLADAEQLDRGHRSGRSPCTPSVDDAVAAGYQSIGDGRASVSSTSSTPKYLANPTILDADAPESLVYRLEADGSKTLTTAMYMLPPGATTDDVPDIAGNLTVWHAHHNLCFAPGTQRLAGCLRQRPVPSQR